MAFILLIYVCNPDSIPCALEDSIFISDIIPDSTPFARISSVFIPDIIVISTLIDLSVSVF